MMERERKIRKEDSKQGGKDRWEKKGRKYNGKREEEKEARIGWRIGKKR